MARVERDLAETDAGVGQLSRCIGVTVDLEGGLDWLEERLSSRRYLCGAQLTEADVRLFPTLIRFDAAYGPAFGCSLRRLVDYPCLWAYTRDLYQHPGVAETVMPLELYRRGYHSIPIAVGHRRIVSPMPSLDLLAPHGREALSRTEENFPRART